MPDLFGSTFLLVWRKRALIFNDGRGENLLMEKRIFLARGNGGIENADEDSMNSREFEAFLVSTTDDTDGTDRDATPDGVGILTGGNGESGGGSLRSLRFLLLNSYP